MKRIGRRATILMVVALYFILCSGFFLVEYATEAKDWVVSPVNQHIYQKGSLVVPAKVLSSDDVVLFTSGDSGSAYAKSATLRKATLHAIGDRNDSINTGVIYTYRANLIGYDPLNGVYNPQGEETTISLTLNSELAKTAWDALGKYNGTVAVYNYQTGEILCMVSKPSFDPHNVPDLSGDAYEGVYINRLTGGVYAPGSIFKLITSLAAIEKIPDIYTQTFTCTGTREYGVDKVVCHSKHGKLNFEKALAKSCNCAFAAIADQLGKDVLSQYAAAYGVGKHFSVDGVRTSKGLFNLTDAAKVEVAWAAIGQHTTLVNPMQYLIFMGAIANGGSYVTPYYVNSVSSSSAVFSYLRTAANTTKMIEPSSAAALKKLMRNNTKETYGESNFSGLELCAKTGTAETANGAPHSWFVGFSDNSKTPLAFVVIAEHAGSGSGVALTAAKTVVKQAAKLF